LSIGDAGELAEDKIGGRIVVDDLLERGPVEPSLAISPISDVLSGELPDLGVGWSKITGKLGGGVEI